MSVAQNSDYQCLLNFSVYKGQSGKANIVNAMLVEHTSLTNLLSRGKDRRKMTLEILLAIFIILFVMALNRLFGGHVSKADEQWARREHKRGIFKPPQ